jgi:Tol biopolymer transport system component
VVGTPGYMSPEQLLGRSVGPGTDLFSLGTVIYEMCSGEPAFRSSDQGDLVDAILNREPASLSRMNYEVPEELERIVRKALAKRADERYQSAAEMIADLRALRRRSGTHSVSDEPSVEPATQRRHWGRALLGAAAVLTLLTISWLVTRPPSDALPEWIPRQLTSDPGWERDPALSPDGTLVAYTSDRGGRPDIWIVDARGGEPRRLTDHADGAHSPAWFPDGRALVFVSGPLGEEAIWKAPWPGGSPVRLLSEARDPAISPDGKRIAFARPGPSGQMRIALVELADLSRVDVLTSDGDGMLDHRDPAWSPDGRSLTYADFRDLWLVPASGGPARRLTHEHAIDRQPAWSPGGRFVYFSSMREGAWALWRAATNGTGPSRLTLGTGPEVQPSLSRGGTRLSYSTFVSNKDIVILDTRTGARSRIAGERDESLGAVAPDGSSVVFSSDREGTYDLWVQELREGRPEGPPRRLTDQAGSEALPTFSPDGRWIAYGRVIDDQRDIWIIPSLGGVSRRITSDPGVDVHPTWSPDGSRLAFVSSRNGGYDVWVRQILDGAPQGEPLQLTSGESTDLFPAWSPDGSTIAYLGESGGQRDVWLVSARNAAPPRRVTSAGDFSWVRWDPSSDNLLVSGARGGETVRLCRLEPDTGRTEEFDFLVTMGRITGNDFVLGSFDVSRDGRFVAYSESRPRGDIWILEIREGSF